MEGKLTNPPRLVFPACEDVWAVPAWALLKVTDRYQMTVTHDIAHVTISDPPLLRFEQNSSIRPHICTLVLKNATKTLHQMSNVNQKKPEKGRLSASLYKIHLRRLR